MKHLDEATRAALAGVRLERAQAPAGPAAGGEAGASRGGAVEFAEHRPYAPGDDVRRLDWAVLARRDQPVIRQHEARPGGAVQIVLDRSESMAFPDAAGPASKLAYAKRIAAALAWVAVQSGDAVGFAAHGQRLPMRCGAAQLARLDEALTAVTADGADPWPATLVDRGASQVVLIGDFLDTLPPLAATLQALIRRRQAALNVQILHPAERDLALIGRREAVRFRDPERLSQAVTVEPEAVRQAYRERVRRHVEEVAAATRRAGGDHLLLTTAMAIGPGLRAHFRDAARERTC